MSFKPFALLSLSSKVLYQIFEELFVLEVFELSQCSKTTRNIIKSTYESKKYHFFIRFQHEFCEVYLEREFDFTDSAKWHIFSCRHVEYPDIDQGYNKLRGVEYLKGRQFYQGINLYMKSGSREKLAVALIESFKEFLNCELQILTVDMEGVEDLGTILEAECLYDCHGSVEMKGGSLQLEETQQFFENFKYNYLQLEVSLNPNYRYDFDKAKLQPGLCTLVISYGSWIRSFHLMSMLRNFQIVWIQSETRMERTELNECIKNWLRVPVLGNNPFDHYLLRRSKNYADDDQEIERHILEGCGEYLITKRINDQKNIKLFGVCGDTGRRVGLTFEREFVKVWLLNPEFDAYEKLY